MIDFNEKGFEKESYAIPADIIPEIAQIILQTGLPHEIIGVKENCRQVIIEIAYKSNFKFHSQAIDNISDLLKDYHELRSEEGNNINWRGE
ncbi:MAG: hypothetical protein NT150_13875 [Bacteroidetes bacterium]|nr:hypothetical protein [Bacteroidota bacterium]